jgi:hypothetical protein
VISQNDKSGSLVMKKNTKGIGGLNNGLLLIVCWLSMTFLAGCSTKNNSIFRSYSPTNAKSTTSVIIDAKQRAIITMPNSEKKSSTGGKTQKSEEESDPPVDTQNSVDRRLYYTCAEPSPDALSALSSTFSASAGTAGASKDVQVAFAKAIEETASQLGKRNATIQLLRDGLYRQCEAYMNGLIDQPTYEQIANKYVNASVAMLAIEQLTPSSLQSQSKITGGSGSISSGTNVYITSKKSEKDTTKMGEANKQESQDGNEPTGDETTADSSEANGNNEASGAEGEVPENTGSSATAKAGSPVVAVNVVGSEENGQEPIPQHVSQATALIFTEFLHKDTLDTCLYRLPRLIQSNVPEKTLGYAQALVDICKNLLREQSASVEKIRTNYIQSSFLEDENTKKLENYVGWNGKLFNNKENQEKLSSWIKENKLSVSVPFLLNSELMRDARKKAVTDLIVNQD